MQSDCNYNIPAEKQGLETFNLEFVDLCLTEFFTKN